MTTDKYPLQLEWLPSVQSVRSVVKRLGLAPQLSLSAVLSAIMSAIGPATAEGFASGLRSAYDIINPGGGNNPISLHTMIGWIESKLSGGPDSRRAVIAAQPPSPADMQTTWADISKAGRLLGWKPGTSPADGFQKTMQWFIENRDLVREIKV